VKIVRFSRTVAGVGASVLAALWSATALGQVFDKFDERARTEMPATPFVAGAYAFIWVALGVYVFIIARGLGRAEAEVAELKRRVEARGASARPGPSDPAGTTR
jgi:CcmD family protein